MTTSPSGLPQEIRRDHAGPSGQGRRVRSSRRRLMPSVVAAGSGSVVGGRSSRGVRVPMLGGATGWLNSPPLGPRDLDGHALLVNFWTFTCINWLRTAPYVRAWAQAYHDDGLIVIGVHTPEFSFEHDQSRVGQALTRHGISYPVAVDNDYAIWNAFANNYWPALYFLDSTGAARGHHFGEGEYSRSEATVQRLLDVNRPLVSASTHGQGIEAEADWADLRTPETYLGYASSESFATLDVASGRHGTYRLPETLGLNTWALSGEWTVRAENIALERPGGSIAIRFHARDAHLVLSSRSAQPVGFQVLLDGAPPGRSHGVDTDPDGRGQLTDARLYQLIRNSGTIRDQTLHVTFHHRGAEAYAFTFG